MKLSEVISIGKSNVHAKGQGQRSRSQRTRTSLAVSRTLLQFEFTYDDEMMQKAWCCLGKEPYCLLRSSVIYQSPLTNKSWILTQIGCFGTVTPVWIQQWLRNDAQSLKYMYHRRGAVLFFKVIHQISMSDGLKKKWFESNLRLQGQLQLSNHSDLPCFKKFILVSDNLTPSGLSFCCLIDMCYYHIYEQII